MGIMIDKIPIENAARLLFFKSKSEALLFTFLTTWVPESGLESAVTLLVWFLSLL